MNSFRWTVLGMLAIIAIAAGLLWFERRAPGLQDIVVTIDGPPGTTVTVTMDVDGGTSSREMSLPATLTQTVKSRISFAINRLDGPEGAISATLQVAGEIRAGADGRRGVIGRLELDGAAIRLVSVSGN